MFRFLFTILVYIIGLPVYSQHKDPEFKDPQNMKVEAEYTDCHKLPSTFQSSSEAIKVLENSRFYYDQSLKTTRRSGLMQARFVSCDFKTGYLLIKFDGIDQVYSDVDLTLWEQFRQTADIDKFYFDKIKHLPNIPEK